MREEHPLHGAKDIPQMVGCMTTAYLDVLLLQVSNPLSSLRSLESSALFQNHRIEEIPPLTCWSGHEANCSAPAKPSFYVLALLTDSPGDSLRHSWRVFRLARHSRRALEGGLC